MSESATTTRVERRMRKTASSLTSVSRRLTAERGLAGFTIEEVCDAVDVSRRTFFNYFASKEDAVIGANPDEEFRRFTEEFLATGAGGWPEVLNDLIALTVEHIESEDMDPREHTDLMAALEASVDAAKSSRSSRGAGLGVACGLEMGPVSDHLDIAGGYPQVSDEIVLEPLVDRHHVRRAGHGGALDALKEARQKSLPLAGFTQAEAVDVLHPHRKRRRPPGTEAGNARTEQAG